MDRASVAAKITALFSAGPVTFERFMQAALYDSEVGYYSSRIRSVGARGDFSTASTLHPILGEAIATWLKSLRKSQLQSLHIIEIGAGTGALAKAILDKLGFLTRSRTHYHIVEVSEPLKVIQEETLHGRSVHWHADMNAALAACDGIAHIFSNELPDAFPCRIFVKTSAQWNELALELREGNPVEVLIPVSSSEKILEQIAAHPFPDGQRIEIQESYRTWLKSWLPVWRSGEMLTIDYGDTFPGLYHRRPRGTV
ncbi:MAG: SAM-dependent methyltransferase, partial [Chthoniobacterales bacterium]